MAFVSLDSFLGRLYLNLAVLEGLFYAKSCQCFTAELTIYLLIPYILLIIFESGECCSSNKIMQLLFL